MESQSEKLDRAIRFYLGGLDSRTAAKEAGVHKDTLLHRMRKQGIARRTLSEAALLKSNTLTITPALVELIDGLMLGDGSIKKRSPSACIVLANKNKGFIDSTDTKLKALGIFSNIRLYRNTYYYLQTPYYPALCAQFDRWYPGGVKKVPEDVIVTPLSVQIWYMGDGNLSGTRCPGTGNVSYYVRISTDSFTLVEQNTLIKKLAATGVTASVANSKNGRYMLRIKARHLDYFYAFMGEPICDSMRYKWDMLNKAPIKYKA